MKQGTVVDIKDPLNLGRIRLRLDRGQQNMKREDLPWRYPPVKTFEPLRVGDRIKV